MVRYSTEHVSAFDSTYLVSSVTSAFEAWLKLTAQRLRASLEVHADSPCDPRSLKNGITAEAVIAQSAGQAPTHQSHGDTTG